MSLFGKETARLIRTAWQTVQTVTDKAGAQLAELPISHLTNFSQEVYALLCGKIPITQDAPVTINNGANGPALTINQAADSPFPAITVNRGGETFTFGSPGGTTGGTTGGIDLGTITFPGSTNDPNAVPNASDTPFPLWGVVGNKVAGSVYKVTVYAKDPATSPAIGVFDVTQGLIDPDDTIPAGTPTLVLIFPGVVGTQRTVKKAMMQVPVHLTPV
jgi:hypothetical protein